MEMRREVSVMELDTETILDALNDFERKPSANVPPVLENLLVWIAKTGDTLYPWTKLKPVFICKLEKVIQEYVQMSHEEVPLAPNVENVKFDDMRHRLVKAINTFSYAPFTIQRLCELVTEPKRYYKRSDKFMRGIEKNIMVVSTVSPDGKRQLRSSDFEKPVAMVNGIDHTNSNNTEEQIDLEKNTENLSNTNSNSITDSVENNEDVSHGEEQNSTISEQTEAATPTHTTEDKSSEDVGNDQSDKSKESTKSTEESVSELTDESNSHTFSTCQSEQSDQLEASIKPEESNQPETSIDTTSVTKEQLNNEMDQS